MPPTATALRLEIEATLSQRIPGALSPRLRQEVELFPTGVEAIDSLLDGGIPRGGLSEIAGQASTGRTGLILSAVALLTQKGAACAWVDVHDALDPESAASCGVVLERLLWIRAGHPSGEAISPPRTSPRATALQAETAASHGHGLHPRNETRNLDHAVSQLFRGENGPLRDKRIGTPGMPNRSLSDLNPRCAEPQPHRRREEQVAIDRLPPRRGEAVLKSKSTPQSVEARTIRNRDTSKSGEPKPWSRLEQSLKATDLLLQAGGFSMIVLDMGNLPAQHAIRVPLATWYRFRLAAEQAQAAMVVLTQESCAKSCASMVLHCQRAREGRPWAAANNTALFEGMEYRVSIERKRQEGLGKKPPGKAAANWAGRSQWIR